MLLSHLVALLRIASRTHSLILLIAILALRAAALWAPSADLQNDNDSYLRLATNLAESGVYGFDDSAGTVTATAFRPPLYPWLLSWCVVDGRPVAAWIAALHLVLGVATAMVVYSIGRELRIATPALAAIVTTLDPLLLRASQLVMTESLACFLFVASWRLWLIVWPKRENVRQVDVAADLTNSPREASAVLNNGTTPPAMKLNCEQLPDCPVDGRQDAMSRSGRQWSALAALGVVLGLSILARPTAAPFALLCICAVLGFGCRCRMRRVTDSLILCVGIGLLVLPWTLRNWAEIGKPIWATTHGGYTFLLANNPSLYRHFEVNGPSRSWDAEPFHRAWAQRGKVDPSLLSDAEFWLGGNSEMSAAEPPEIAVNSGASDTALSGGELRDDQLAYDVAFSTVARQPATFVLSSLWRAGWLWAWWPNQGGWIEKTLIGLWYAAWSGVAAWGLLRLMRYGQLWPWVPALAGCVALTAVHAFYWSNMRMRGPIMPAVYLIALSSTAPLLLRIPYLGGLVRSRSGGRETSPGK